MHRKNSLCAHLFERRFQLQRHHVTRNVHVILWQPEVLLYRAFLAPGNKITHIDLQIARRAKSALAQGNALGILS
jgi:hypothetical protein